MQNKQDRTQTRLSIRASRDELKRWQEDAKEAGFKTTVSYCRTLLNGMACNPFNQINAQDEHSIIAELREYKDQISRIGNNLNQIAKKLHSGEGDCYRDVNDHLRQCLNSMENVDILISELRRLRQ